mmetsp:Transcript_31788/g.63053  ORF Transcript_31788/g.63053 Transcript_31788/m.63053 type:complete len:427 (+) Transcript_31788:179-1459(+)|eukprot:CAMPEP_0182468060 /NCGR_PEP_ID=MMETSP1319-20130603/14907_1 /TAXON_ID=172717 /ORGANISM="Bolidomonas pacifica, Strain RCC208" /LENGTH=426 /DNA_ID=CAMNT_0024668223 /DNA_START=117 /DNA_END=1397 /DNA_ORIENTATION=+
MTSPPERSRFTKPHILLLVVLSKLVMNSTNRFLTPFVAFFSEGMGISVEKFTVALLAVGEVASLLSLSISKHAAKLEPGTLAAICYFFAGLFNLAVLLLPDTLVSTWALVTMCLLRLGFGTCYNLSLSAIQSSLASNVDPEWQGRITGIVESSWTLASASFAAVGILLNKAGWKGPFVLNGALTLLFALPLYFALPSDKQSSKEETKKTAESQGLNKESKGLAMLSFESLGLYGCLLLKDTGTYLILTTFSLWLEEQWGHGAEEAGFASLVISAGEGLAVLMMATVSDWIGIENCVSFVSFAIAIGTIGFGIFEADNLHICLAFFGLTFMFFEWGAISMIAYAGSKFTADTRVSALSTVFCCMAIARSVSAVIAEPIYELPSGMKGVVFSGAILQLCAATLFVCTRNGSEGRGSKREGMVWVERQL